VSDYDGRILDGRIGDVHCAGASKQLTTDKSQVTVRKFTQ